MNSSRISLMWFTLLFVNNSLAECGEARCTLRSCISKCDKCCPTSSFPRSYFSTRSVGSNMARQLVGWEDKINLYRPCEKKLWGASTLAFEFQETFRPRDIARQLFGTRILNFKGSQVASRTDRDIIADYFGLPTTYQGTLSVCPKIKNWITEFQIYFGLDKWLSGLYLRINAPIVKTQWNLHARARDKNNGTQEALFPVGYMGVNPENPVSGPIGAISQLQEALTGCQSFGDKKEPWYFGQFSFDALELTRLSNLDIILGWNFAQNLDYHLGLSAYAVIPGGNKPDPEFIFSPVIGNGKHYEFGLGFSAHQDLWASAIYPEQKLSIYIEGCINHLFKNIQRRTFDFCGNGQLSRYLLLKQIGKPALLQNGKIIVAEDPNAYANNLISGVNWATRFASVSVPLKVDAAIKLAYNICSLEIDIGYNFYSQTREKVCILRDYPTVYDSNRFGIKGLEGTHYFVRSTPASSQTNVATLNSTSSTSNLYHASLQDQLTTDNPVPVTGPGKFGYLPSGQPSVLEPDNYGANWHNPNLTIDQTAAQAQSNNSLAYYSGNGTVGHQPAILTLDNLNPYSAMGRGFITHKFFGFINYNSPSEWRPFIGIGGEIEFEAKSKKRGHEQWGVFVKAGLTF